MDRALAEAEVARIVEEIDRIRLEVQQFGDSLD
jgi:hypothetical protein